MAGWMVMSRHFNKISQRETADRAILPVFPTRFWMFQSGLFLLHDRSARKWARVN
jgi:hypothetical protein